MKYIAYVTTTHQVSVTGDDLDDAYENLHEGYYRVIDIVNSEYQIDELFGEEDDS